LAKFNLGAQPEAQSHPSCPHRKVSSYIRLNSWKALAYKTPSFISGAYASTLSIQV